MVAFLHIVPAYISLETCTGLFDITLFVILVIYLEINLYLMNFRLKAKLDLF